MRHKFQCAALLLALQSVLCLKQSGTRHLNNYGKFSVARFGPQEFFVSSQVELPPVNHNVFISHLCVLPPHTAWDATGKVVLVLRGKCAFIDKGVRVLFKQRTGLVVNSAVAVVNAQVAGASAVIVGDMWRREAGPLLSMSYPQGMKASFPNISIPAVFVSYNTYSNLNSSAFAEPNLVLSYNASDAVVNLVQAEEAWTCIDCISHSHQWCGATGEKASEEAGLYSYCDSSDICVPSFGYQAVTHPLFCREVATLVGSISTFIIICCVIPLFGICSILLLRLAIHIKEEGFTWPGSESRRGVYAAVSQDGDQELDLMNADGAEAVMDVDSDFKVSRRVVASQKDWEYRVVD